eukprot:scaffold41794_cov20-Tisochrysis_lutea.AAC.1
MELRQGCSTSSDQKKLPVTYREWLNETGGGHMPHGRMNQFRDMHATVQIAFQQEKYLASEISYIGLTTVTTSSYNELDAKMLAHLPLRRIAT